MLINKALGTPDSALAPRDCGRVGDNQAVAGPPAEKTRVYDRSPLEGNHPQNTLPRGPNITHQEHLGAASGAHTSQPAPP